MWTTRQLIDDLRDIGLKDGDSVLVHTSLRAIGPIDGGAETLIQALRTVLGSTGTLVVPTFTTFTAEHGEGGAETACKYGVRDNAVLCYDAENTPADIRAVGIFPEIVRQHGEARRSEHPLVSFAAIGASATYLTENAPFHYPLGSDSTLARLHQRDGKVLLIGVGHRANSTLHLAEVWSDAPYIHRSIHVRTGQQEWTSMQGSPGCSDGFTKIEPLLRQSRLLKHGYIGNAVSQLMQIRPLVSMGIAVLQGNGAALLCDRPQCASCLLARKFTMAQDALPDGGVVEF